MDGHTSVHSSLSCPAPGQVPLLCVLYQNLSSTLFVSGVNEVDSSALLDFWVTTQLVPNLGIDKRAEEGQLTPCGGYSWLSACLYLE